MRPGLEQAPSGIERAPPEDAAPAASFVAFGGLDLALAGRAAPFLAIPGGSFFGLLAFRAPRAAPSLAVAAVLSGTAPARAAVGAFAYDEATGKYGASWNQPSDKQAEEAALKGCASEKCKIVFRTKGGQCGAIAATETGKAWGGATRPKREEAEKAALASCEKRPGAAGKCKVKTVDCNSK